MASAWSGFVWLFAASVLLSVCVQAVDRSNFKTCDQSSFCKRNRAITPGESPYTVVADSVSIEDTGCTMDILNTRNNVLLTAEVSTLEDSMFRLKIKEKTPLRPRYEVEGALAAEPTRESCKVQRSSGGLEITSTKTKASVTFEPFQMEFYINNEIAVVLNSRGLMNFEHYRNKRFLPTPAPPPEDGGENDEGDGDNPDSDDDNEEAEPQEEVVPDGGVEDVAPVEGDEEPGMWEETFKSHSDSKPYGPSSIGMDISFPGVNHVYGIPEHADSLTLKPTVGGEPYRLYNLDVFEYELNNRMALYGSIPLMLAHNWSKTVGVFWHNAAETWIDITNSAANKNILGKLLSYFKSEEEVPQTDTHWMSESGIIDVFIMLGPRTGDIFRQYSSLTGTTVLPPLFSLAYHQCRWNYNDEQDVENVDNGFDENDIPYDVLWLDIEHTDGKRYFTWDAAKFPNSVEMQNKLAAKGRKMVTIIDPHIKRDGNYHIHKDAEAKDLYVKRSDGTSTYEGWCWPGSSSWIDFVSPDIRQWWAEQFALDKYQGSTNNLFTWNDMNEPSVFNGPEITMHKDCKHYGGWEHRDVHNIYGMFGHQATAEGQVMRSGGRDRPFVLSRAFFAGTQRFGAIWTGDNKAAWDHLAASIPMLLSISIAGLPFVGADVGGFFTNPDPELLVRWYQAGAFYPFFRAHAHLDTRRREPWLFDADKTAIMREAIRLRYQLLPLWYVLFYESHKSGLPVMRPVWVEFSRDKNTYEMDDQFMVGSYLMVKPVVEQYATTTQLYLPGQNTLWYDFDDYTQYKGGSRYQINTPLSKIPIFQRGGTIVIMKQRVRRSSVAMDDDPITLIVALDRDGDAMGKIFIDDGHSFDYKNGQFMYRTFTFTTNTLIGSNSDTSGIYESKSWLEKVIVAGITGTPTKALLSCDGEERYLDISFDDVHKNHVLTIRKPGINVSRDFSITLS